MRYNLSAIALVSKFMASKLNIEINFYKMLSEKFHFEEKEEMT